MDESGKRLREYLLDRKIGQSEVAAALNVSAAYVNMICMGKKGVGKKTAAKLQDAIGVSAGWLLTGEGNMYVCPCPIKKEETESVEVLDEKSLEQKLNVIKIYTKVIEDVQTLNKQLAAEVAEVIRLKNELIEVLSQFRKDI